MKLITFFRKKLGPLTFVSDLLTGYMRRRMIWSPWGTLRLHHILSSDAGRDLHDHPWDFTSILLSRGYTEHLPGGFRSGIKHWPRFSVIKHKAEDLHSLELDGPCWTFVITGPVRRDWGFQTSQGWLSHKVYDGVSMGKRGAADEDQDQ